MPDQLDWLDGIHPAPADPLRGVPKLSADNPCVRVYGRGPTGATCQTCARLERWDNPGRKVFLKCSLRQRTHGAASDHRDGWPACGRYVEREEASDDGRA